MFKEYGVCPTLSLMLFEIFPSESVSAAIFEIMGHKHIGITTLTLQGYVTSSVT